jgi:hypothetical protein
MNPVLGLIVIVEESGASHDRLVDSKPYRMQAVGRARMTRRLMMMWKRKKKEGTTALQPLPPPPTLIPLAVATSSRLPIGVALLVYRCVVSQVDLFRGFVLYITLVIDG